MINFYVSNPVLLRIYSDWDDFLSIVYTIIMCHDITVFFQHIQ